MLNKHRAFKLLAACAALAWCLAFTHVGTTDKSMIRAVLLSRTAAGWEAGFLYQSPEPSADASEASAEVAFTSADGQTLEQALAAAERTLPQEANYRLCDHVLLAEGGSTVLDAYERLLLARQCGRLAARVMLCDFDFEELSAASEEISELPKSLLQCAKQSSDVAPRLYERADGLLLPVLELTENGAARRDEGVLLLDGREHELTANETAAALLLSGKDKNYIFALNGGTVQLSRAVCTLTAQGEGFALRVDCLPAPAAEAPTAEQLEKLEALLGDVIELFWQDGADILRLRETRELKYGAAGEKLPAKSMCPSVRVEVRMVI